MKISLSSQFSFPRNSICNTVIENATQSCASNGQILLCIANNCNKLANSQHFFMVQTQFFMYLVEVWPNMF